MPDGMLNTAVWASRIRLMEGGRPGGNTNSAASPAIGPSCWMGISSNKSVVPCIVSRLTKDRRDNCFGFGGVTFKQTGAPSLMNSIVPTS